MKNFFTILICSLALMGMGEEIEFQRKTLEDPYRMNPCMIVEEDIQPEINMNQMEDGTDLFHLVDPDETEWI